MKKKKRIVLNTQDYHNLNTEVHHRDNWKCRCCKRRTKLCSHHIVFRSQGGDDASWNLITMCDPCHKAVHERWIVILPTNECEKIVDANKEVKFLFVNGWKPRYKDTA